ncbi:MAG: potassium-transporting ATPase subunit KdpA, partial [Myxococcaceae bacterium]|nr:potassium-transporting ATPase subunit KdpA [Myxococcaceae bacterium]
MSEAGLYFVVLLALAAPLGLFMAHVYERPVSPFERWLSGGAEEMTWKRYTFALVAFNALGIVALYALQRVQGVLPLNPQGLGAVPPELAFNTAVSFGSNTNWQAYGGETTLSYLTQMVGLTTQNFVSAATGMAVLVALVRGFTRSRSETVGNFWVDLSRSTLWVLLPLSAVVALVLVSQGVVQTFAATTNGVAVGPAASQVAIKQLGTNGGG